MPVWLWAMLLGLWTAWWLQAVLSVLLVRRFLRRFDREPHPDKGLRPALATVIVPFKGAEADLAGAVRGLCNQTYPNYRLVFVVESAADPACPVLQSVLAQYGRCNARIVEAGVSGPQQGQKVHNQLRVMEQLLAEDQDDPDEVWVFADSDAVPHDHWLADLIARLGEVRKTAVTTGYRWLVPVARPGRKPTLWSQVASVMNASVAVFLGRDSTNHAWGGSMALRRDTAIEGDLVGRLRGALCDDYQFTRLARDLGKRIYFVQSCLVASPVDFTLRQLVNFAHRQYLLTRVYAPGLFAAVLGLTSLYVLGTVSAWAVLIYGLATRQSAWIWGPAAGAMAIVFLANQVRATYRRQVVVRAFGEQILPRLRGTLRLERWGTSFWMLVHWLLVLRAAVGRKMAWRGIRYRLLGPQRVHRLDHV